MAFDVKRKAELTLATLLMEALPDLTFYVSKGGDDDGGTTLPKPPFGVVWIDNAENMMPNSKTYLLTGTVVWVTRAEAKVGGDVAEHSDSVASICDALLNIGRGDDVDRSLIVCGVDIDTVNEYTDSDRQAHGDTISFTMGVNEFS